MCRTRKTAMNGRIRFVLAEALTGAAAMSSIPGPSLRPLSRLTMSTDVTGPSTNDSLLAWVSEAVALCEPHDVHWCDGSSEEYERLCDALVETGTFVRPSDELRPATSDTAKGGQAQPADSLKESQLAAGHGAFTSRRRSPTSQIESASLKGAASCEPESFAFVGRSVLFDERRTMRFCGKR